MLKRHDPQMVQALFAVWVRQFELGLWSRIGLNPVREFVEVLKFCPRFQLSGFPGAGNQTKKFPEWPEFTRSKKNFRH